MASRERGNRPAFGMWFDARMRTKARKGRKNMGMAVIRMMEVGCAVGPRWPEGGSFARLRGFSVVQQRSNAPGTQ